MRPPINWLPGGDRIDDLAGGKRPDGARHARGGGNTTGPTDDDRSIASGRTMTEISSGEGRSATAFMTTQGAAAGSVWQSNRDDSLPTGLIPPAKAEPSAKAKTVKNLPDFIDPQLAASLEKPPTGTGWAHEIQFDGYRRQGPVMSS